jgi:hypothetical protein
MNERVTQGPRPIHILAPPLSIHSITKLLEAVEKKKNMFHPSKDVPWNILQLSFIARIKCRPLHPMLQKLGIL